MSDTIRVDGLADVRRALARLGPEYRGGLTAELKDIARIASTRAQAIAEAEGLRDTGNLIRKIKPSVRGTTAMIRESAVKVSRKYPTGYPYPGVYEYAGRGVAGPRPFMHPAAEQTLPAMVQRLTQLLDRVAIRVGLK